MSRILESRWTTKFLKDLRQLMPEAEVIKTNAYGGMSEGGLPDFSVTRFDVGPWSKTVWCEVKLLPASGPLFVPLQLARLRRLGGWYLFWDTKDRMGWLFRAEEQHAWPDLARYTRTGLLERIARFF